MWPVYKDFFILLIRNYFCVEMQCCHARYSDSYKITFFYQVQKFLKSKCHFQRNLCWLKTKSKVCLCDELLRNDFDKYDRLFIGIYWFLKSWHVKRDGYFLLIIMFNSCFVDLRMCAIKWKGETTFGKRPGSSFLTKW